MFEVTHESGTPCFLFAHEWDFIELLGIGVTEGFGVIELRCN